MTRPAAAVPALCFVAMAQITALATLLAQMSPHLRDEAYVFCAATTEDARRLAGRARAIVMEDEGVTLVVDRSVADAEGLPYEGVFRMITLTVNSSLEAVGFLAAVSSALAEQRIAVNALAGALHDHLLVPSARAEDAMRILGELQSTWRDRTARRTTS